MPPAAKLPRRRVLAACLAAALAAAPVQAQELVDLLPGEPELWLEVPDLDRLSLELAETSLGHLLGLVTSQMDPAEIALRLALPEAALEAGAEGGVRGVLRGLALELGLSAERADVLVSSLEGALELARLEPRDGGSELAGLVVAASLRPGASLRLTEEVLRSLEPDPAGVRRARGLELLQLAREEDECRAAWTWSPVPQLPTGFLVVRPGRLAFVFERELAERLLAADPPRPRAASGGLAAARAASRERGELVFVRITGRRLARASADPEARALLAVLGLGQLASVELGLGTRAGQLTSRLRVDPLQPRAPAPASQRARARAPEGVDWPSLDALSTDTLAVLGLARSPWQAGELVAALEGSDGAKFLARLGRTPLFGALRAPGALADETLLFARAAGPGVPILYAATPATPAVDKAFEVLGRRGARDVPLGQGLLLRPRPLADGEAWVLYTEEGGRRRSVLALSRVDQTWVGSDVSAQLQSLLRQRGRERLSARAKAVLGLRAALAAQAADAGCEPSDVVAFLHVHTPALAELLWPYAQLALQVTGAVEDPEDLPDPLDVAELLGDTTLVVLDLGDALEVHGRGLLGGLVVVF